MNSNETSAARDVLAERDRQRSVEGWTAEHDDTHGKGEMARAAATYAFIGGLPEASRGDAVETRLPRNLWPWSQGWLKPKDRRRDLVRAGALILAEIERLDRARDTP